MTQPARTPSTPALLQVEHLALAYGGIEAVKGVDLQVFPGELVSLISSNGAGKYLFTSGRTDKCHFLSFSTRCCS